MTLSPALNTFLWYKAGQLDAAIEFYSNIFGNQMQVTSLNRFGPGAPLFTASFSIYGQDFIGMSIDGGPDFNDSISLSLSVDGQAEVDRLWDALIADGGKPGQCGWCKDQFGVSWQVTPHQMGQYLGNPDSAIREYANQALRNMTKIVLSDFVK
jgi:predicted 3-demethylubiquinone-9 3-methyltransferase (glyoxalase superfamily)